MISLSACIKDSCTAPWLIIIYYYPLACPIFQKIMFCFVAFLLFYDLHLYAGNQSCQEFDVFQLKLVRVSLNRLMHPPSVVTPMFS